VAVLHGLAGCYLLQAAGGQMAVMAERQPIAAVIDDPRTAPELRLRLTDLGAARDFASRELKLPDNGSYRQYADIGRRYVVWNVFAAPRFSVEPRRWCFPVAGCVVYRGYFAEQSAERYAGRLSRRGDDVAVGGVAAYSTLGHFEDPVLNTMLGWSDAQLAGTVFHELAHQLVYVQGDSAFNEAFASTVEEEGVMRWLTVTNRLRELEAWQLQRQRAADFSRLLLGARERLRVLFASGVPFDEMANRKQQVFGELKVAYEEQRRQWDGYTGYDAWFSRTLNNADLISTATYRRCMPGFQRILASVNGDLEQFYDKVRVLAAAPSTARRSLCETGS
jgi:predicted aminopeptidase